VALEGGREQVERGIKGEIINPIRLDPGAIDLIKGLRSPREASSMSNKICHLGGRGEGGPTH
jgi:hypothetical protein